MLVQQRGNHSSPDIDGCFWQAVLLIGLYAMSFDGMRAAGRLGLYFTLLALTAVLIFIQTYTYKIYFGIIKRREEKSCSAIDEVV